MWETRPIPPARESAIYILCGRLIAYLVFPPLDQSLPARCDVDKWITLVRAHVEKVDQAEICLRYK
jgi:hypothetical protein